ncbi:MAG: hypothetical protein GEU73_14315 [Chloroflexi bacterium]|nr:hypothetical protein [Chloroflexota bacterium]
MSVSVEVQYRRAIEALRSGVPNRDAVQVLGSSQPRIEEKFREHLQAAREGVAAGTQAPGILVEGDFGSGKSHLLEHLQHVALEEHYVCSKVVISKDTPLYDPAKLFRAAIGAAVVPDRKGVALTEIAASLQPTSPAYQELAGWASRPESGLNSRFAATLFLYPRMRGNEGGDRILSFWAGDPLNAGELRAWLRAHGEAASYRLESVPARQLPVQRFAFTTRLSVAAGYAGWVLLVDEVELIGRYSFRQRARSYASLARWAGKLQSESLPGLATVFAITTDFARAVLEQRGDVERVPGKLRAIGLDSDRMMASQAERGMRFIAREALRLRGPEPETIEETMERLREIHGKAYGWEPPPAEAARRPGSTSMRQYVRRWINEWDLMRLFAGYSVETVVQDLAVRLGEDPELETPSEWDEGDDPRP